MTYKASKNIVSIVLWGNWVTGGLSAKIHTARKQQASNRPSTVCLRAVSLLPPQPLTGKKNIHPVELLPELMAAVDCITGPNSSQVSLVSCSLTYDISIPSSNRVHYFFSQWFAWVRLHGLCRPTESRGGDMLVHCCCHGSPCLGPLLVPGERGHPCDMELSRWASLDQPSPAKI